MALRWATRSAASRRQLAEDPPRPAHEPVEHRRLEQARRPHVHADQESLGPLVDERLPGRIERALLGGQRRRALEVHARQIDHQIGMAGQEPVEDGRGGRAGVGEHEGGRRHRLERGLEGRGRAGVELLVDDDRHLLAAGDFQQLHERRIGRAPVDLAADLTHVDLAGDAGAASWPAPLPAGSRPGARSDPVPAGRRRRGPGTSGPRPRPRPRRPSARRRRRAGPP